jgi:hypothetical protein
MAARTSAMLISIQRLQKTLEDANIKLDSVISDIMGLSVRCGPLF